MKKEISIVLVCAMLFGLGGCGKSINPFAQPKYEKSDYQVQVEAWRAVQLAERPLLMQAADGTVYYDARERRMPAPPPRLQSQFWPVFNNCLSISANLFGMYLNYKAAKRSGKASQSSISLFSGNTGGTYSGETAATIGSNTGQLIETAQVAVIGEGLAVGEGATGTQPQEVVTVTQPVPYAVPGETKIITVPGPVQVVKDPYPINTQIIQPVVQWGTPYTAP